MLQVLKQQAGVAAEINCGKFPTVQSALAVASASVTQLVLTETPGVVKVVDAARRPLVEFRSFP